MFGFCNSHRRLWKQHLWLQLQAGRRTAAPAAKTPTLKTKRRPKPQRQVGPQRCDWRAYRRAEYLFINLVRVQTTEAGPGAVTKPKAAQKKQESSSSEDSSDSEEEPPPKPKTAAKPAPPKKAVAAAESSSEDSSSEDEAPPTKKPKAGVLCWGFAVFTSSS